MGDADVVVCPACGKRNRLRASATGKPQCGSCHNPLPWITSADDTDFSEIAEKSRLPVLLDLWAPWCAPCRFVSPAVEEMGRAYAGRLKVVKVNVDIAQQVASRFGAMSIPTLILLDRGVERSRKVGALREQQLRAWVDAELSGVKPRAPE